MRNARLDPLTLMNTTAVILAAGASSRMGSDKALLKLPNGTTLLEDQIRRVAAAGIANVRVVLGHNCEIILKVCHRGESPATYGGERRSDPARSTMSTGLLRSPRRTGQARNDVAFIINSNWRSGYFSSIKCGLAGVDTGAVILPLDTVGVPPKVIRQICNKGVGSGKNIVPIYDGKGGHPVFLRPELIKTILAAPLSPRLDHLLQADKETLKLPVGSKNILNNINTPSDWEKCLDTF